MPQTFVLPRQMAVDDDANPLAGALAYFFETGSTTPQAVYTDAALTTTHAHPVVADSAGRWPKIYLNSAAPVNYRVRLTTAAGIQIDQQDDIDRFTVSQTEIAAAINPRTATETAADVTPSSLLYVEGDARRYGMIGNDITDNDAAIGRLRTMAAQGVRCFIPRGTYRYSTSPNWGISGLHLSGERGTILKHTGTGVIFNMDAGADSSNSYVGGLRVSDLILTGNASSTDAFFSRGVTYSSFKNIEVRSCSAKAYHIKWGVANTYDTCIINRSIGGTFSPVPTHGWYLTNAGSGFYTADCTFIGCVAENFDGGVSGVGADFVDASGNTWKGGTFESLTQGLVLRAASRHNSFDGVWFEDNDTNDIVDLGVANTFINIHSQSESSGPTIDVNGAGANFVGGFLRHVELASGSRATSFHGCAFADSPSVGIQGTGTYTAHGCYTVSDSFVFTASIRDVLGARGTFTGSLSGCTTVPTGSIAYSTNGNIVTLSIPAISGTSNTTAAEISGLPTEIRPTVARRLTGLVVNNGTTAVSIMQVETSGVITLFNGVSGTFTGSGTKGVDVNEITYRIA